MIVCMEASDRLVTLLSTYHYPLAADKLSRLKLTLQWRHNEHDGVWNHQPHDCLLNRLYIHRSKKTSKLRVTSLGEGNSPVSGDFPAQMVSNAENVSIWWRYHEYSIIYTIWVL